MAIASTNPATGEVLAEYAPLDSSALEERLAGLGKDVEIHLYEGLDHAFFNDTRPEVYDAATAGQAWAQTVGFLHANLG